MNTLNKVFAFWSISVLLFSGVFSSVVLADPVGVGESQRFMVSAYYSPLPGQQQYVWGSYEADIRMNGQGVRGADFTKVYPGMLAAPRSYSFGTVIKIPGVGVGTVHDRGGAIVERSGYDRIDVWMGWGDDGRVRALQWGMREVTGTIMPAGTADYVEFSVLPASAQKEYSGTSSSSASESAVVSLGIGDRGESVSNVQDFLNRGGYLSVEPTGYFGSQTAAAVFEFQKEFGIVSSWSSPGAGVFGPKTRSAAEKVWENPGRDVIVAAKETVQSIQSEDSEEIEESQSVEESESTVFTVKDGPEEYSPDYAVIQPNLQMRDRGNAVTRLQMVLNGLGYYQGSASGVYDERTRKAVLQYQLDQGIVSSASSTGAGRFGPQTYSRLITQLLNNRKQEKIANEDTDFITAEQIAMRRQKIELAQFPVQYGERSDEVRELQDELIARGFLEEGFNTGYYGEKTRAALGAYKAYMS